LPPRSLTDTPVPDEAGDEYYNELNAEVEERKEERKK